MRGWGVIFPPATTPPFPSSWQGALCYFRIYFFIFRREGKCECCCLFWRKKSRCNVDSLLLHFLPSLAAIGISFLDRGDAPPFPPSPASRKKKIFPFSNIWPRVTSTFPNRRAVHLILKKPRYLHCLFLTRQRNRNCTVIGSDTSQSHNSPCSMTAGKKKI